MKTIKAENKGAVKTAKTTISNKKAIVKKAIHKKGNPAKADQNVIKEYAAEKLLRQLFDVPKSEPMKTILGANEKAYFAQKNAEYENELEQKRKKKGYSVTMTSIGSSDGKMSCVDSHIYKSIEDGIMDTIKEACSMLEVNVPKAIKATTKKYSYKCAKGWWKLNVKDGIDNEVEGAVMKFHARTGYTIVWYLQEQFV